MSKYEKYQLQWMIDHGYSLSDLIEALTKMQLDNPKDGDRISTPISKLFEEWVSDVGFDSEIWACESEWEEYEGEDEKCQNATDRDVYLNPYFGDLWLLENNAFIKINSGCSVPANDPCGFRKVGHIDFDMNKGENIYE